MGEMKKKNAREGEGAPATQAMSPGKTPKVGFSKY